MSILAMIKNRKGRRISLAGPVVLGMLAWMFLTAGGPGLALAASVADVVKEVARANANIEEGFDMGSSESPIAGGSMKWSYVHGDLNTGEEWAGAWFEVVEPAGNTSMARVIEHLVANLDEDANMKVVSASGYEMREITYDDYVLGVPNDDIEVWIILARHVIQVDIHETGYDKATNLQTGRNLALQLKGELDKAGLTQPPAVSPSAVGTAPATPAQPTAVTAKPLAEPVTVADTMNIAGVGNGPTAPTTFSLNSPHLITLITNYHWNNARGAAPGTIGFKDSNGKVYGPWPVTTRLGQGGVPNAYWDVKPNIVVPAGTYTIIDSDPASWSQNAQSGGRGMGEVRATPHFEINGGPGSDLVPGAVQGPTGPNSVPSASPAGVGAVANIPGPANTTEAVVGVVVPGLIATALGALGGLGGSGGLVPPATGMPGSPGGGGTWPGSGGARGPGGGQESSAPATGQIGRRRPEEGLGTSPGSTPENRTEEIFIDTIDILDGIPASGQLPGEGTIIDTAQEAGIFVTPREGIIIEDPHAAVGSGADPGIIIDTAEEAGLFVQPDSGLIIETPAEAGLIKPDPGILVDINDTGIIVDTSALEGTSGQPAPGAPGEKAVGEGTAAEGVVPGVEGTPQAVNDQEGFDKDGFDAKGFDKDGFNKEGFDAQGFDKEGFDKEGFDAKGFDKEGFDKEGFDAKGFDKDGFNKEGFDAKGFDKDGFNKEGFDAQGFDQEGFDKEGFDTKGFDKDGFNKEGFDAQGFDKDGFNKEGFDAKGFDKDGFNKEGFDAKGFDKDGFNKEGFDAKGFDKEGFDKEGFDAKGFDKDGFNKEGFDAKGFDKDGFNKEGFDAQGFDKEGFDKEGFDKNGFDAKGFDKDGFNKEGFDAKGFDKQGFDKEGFDAKGFDKEGFDKEGFDAKGFDKEGFDKEGFDKEGYGRNGFDSQGFDREGYDVNGYNAKGFNRSGFDAQGYDSAGFDKQGFNKAGLDREGFNREGFDAQGFDREGYDKAGFDREGYDREGYDRQGMEREGYDADGYDQNGFNQNGVDKDGFDREGFNYEGYNRAGYDPWGYNKQGYGKDGYHWSGYNADGYNRAGRHWSENPYEGDSPFNVSVEGNGMVNRNPFDGGPVIIEQDNYGNKIDLASSWKPTKPALGEPYPKTLDKYGAKPWTNDPAAPEPSIPTPPTVGNPTDTGVIGPEDPMNTLKQHGLDKDVPAGAEGPADSLPIPEEEVPQSGWPGAEPEDSFPGDQMPEKSGGGTFDYTDPETGVTSTYEYEPGYTGPRHGDRQILVGSGDGQSYEVEFNAATGKWVNTATGNDFDPSRFESWQQDVAEDRRRAAIDLEKMAARQDANSRAIDKNLDDWRQLEQMQKAADRYNIGQPGGPGDMDKAIQDLKDDMLAGQEVDQDRMDQLRKIIGNRITGQTTGDSGERWEEDWVKNLGWGLEANAATAKEVITGEKADGSTSWLGMLARVMITAATGGGASVTTLAGELTRQGAMDGALTVAEAMYRIKDSIDKGESDFQAVSKAVGLVVLGEEMGWLAGRAGGQFMGEMMKRFPAFTNRAADLIERGALKVMKGDQILSRTLGLVSRESAEETLDQINKRLVDVGGDAAEEALEKTIKGGSKAASGSAGDVAGKTSRAVSGSADDLAQGGRTAAAGSKGASADGASPGGTGKSVTDRAPTADGPGSSTAAGTKAGGAGEEAIRPTPGPKVQAEPPGLKIDNNSFKEAGQPPDLRGMPSRDQKAIQAVSERYGVKAQMRPTNPESRVWLETGKAHPKPEMLKTKTINQYDVELGYPKEYSGTVACRKPDPLPAAKPDQMSGEHWLELQKRHKQRMTEYTDQVEKLNHLEQEGKIFWDKKTGIIYNGKTMKPYAGDHDAFAFVDAVSGEPVSPLVNQRINYELQSLGATQHPEHVGWDYSGLSDQIPEGSLPGAQSPRQIAEGIDQKILGGHGEGGQPLNTFDPLRGDKGGWTTSYWKGGVRQ